jgi:hypothetical protein
VSDSPPSSPTPTLDRRTLLTALAGAGTAGLAGCSALTDRGSDADTTDVDPDLANEFATRFAPTLYFDEAEPWPPTDPRPYATEQDGETVVDGFDALNGYHERLADAEEPPNRTVFYNVVEYEGSPLSVVQFWMYAAFDQFTANFHWHDWEVLHVFVDTNTEEAQLYVASSHSTRVPNNEFLDPEPDPAPRILSELGSHSSALSVNDQPDEFQRLPGADLLADITNTAIEGIESIAEIPLAYGLPRDEGGRLPYVVPEYEGQPVYEHDRLPAVDSESLIDGAITVRTLKDLATPPTDLPERSTGMVFRHEGRDAGGEAAGTEYAYDLVPTSELEEISDFSGPQLSFEFAVPQFAEDAVSGHISTAGVPWDQSRYDNPAEDITDPNHRAALAERYDAIGEAAAINTVVTSIGEAVENDDAPDGEGLTTQEPTVEAVALLESESRMIPTFRGVAVARDIPEGDHRLTVNAAGQAPYSERLPVGGSAAETATTEAPATDADTETETTGTVTPNSETTNEAGTEGGDGADETARAERVTTAGVDAEIPLVARENARKLEVDADGTDAELAGVAVEDDFAGRLYDSPTEGSDAVYVHRGGAYTTEVRDVDGALGAFRVNPDPGGGADDDDDDDSGGDGPPGGPPIRIDRPETGKASLSSFLVEIAKETRDQAQAIVDEGDLQGKANGLRGLVRSLDAVIEAAERATENARAGNPGNADRRLRAVEAGIERVVSRLDAIGEEVPEPFVNAVRNRADQAARRATQARAAEKL